MQKLSACCVLAAILFSCTSDTKVKNRTIIKGDWASERVNTGFGNIPLIFCFNDSMCTAKTPFNRFTRYSLEDNILIVQPDTVNDPDAEQLKYTIAKLTADSLFLQPVVNDTMRKKHIRMEKIKEANSLVPEKIFFTSSGCYGSCPSMILEIDSSRNFLFYGILYTEAKLVGHTLIPGTTKVIIPKLWFYRLILFLSVTFFTTGLMWVFRRQFMGMNAENIGGHLPMLIIFFVFFYIPLRWVEVIADLTDCQNRWQLWLFWMTAFVGMVLVIRMM